MSNFHDDKSIKPEEIPYKMLANDPFSQWMGIEILKSEKGSVKLGMTIRNDMLNSMKKAHGGITYSLADTAFGFAANTYGKICGIYRNFHQPY